jgi:hypothetical protein
VKFTNAHISEDGRTVILTAAVQDGADGRGRHPEHIEHYAVWWEGNGRLGHIDSIDASRVAQAFIEASVPPKA